MVGRRRGKEERDVCLEEIFCDLDMEGDLVSNHLEVTAGASKLIQGARLTMRDENHDMKLKFCLDVQTNHNAVKSSKIDPEDDEGMPYDEDDGGYDYDQHYDYDEY
ncbi:hypothetical protein HAX54_020794 [Datura stramonium]|uniref:Uncharacterized protein n=1 Tax=Datura stramonium TaxID=4076 RepID=A0ABS8S2X7_DATST|nr:hypothetical protein [Datura stramonium]